VGGAVGVELPGGGDRQEPLPVGGERDAPDLAGEAGGVGPGVGGAVGVELPGGGDLWVPDIRLMSCDLRVLVDQPAESVPSGNPSSRRDDRWFGGPERWGLPQGAVRAVAVVMINILGQHRPQLPAADDQHPVQQLPPDGAHPPLGVGVGPRRPYRRAQHLDSLGREDRIERGGELRIPIPDEKPGLADAAPQAMSRLRACWVGAVASGRSAAC
jgi:hypothetical protein